MRMLEAVDPGWASRFLAVITDPNVRSFC